MTGREVSTLHQLPRNARLELGVSVPAIFVVVGFVLIRPGCGMPS
jgi:hypothetical protein